MAVWAWVFVGVICEFVLAVGFGRFIAAGHGPRLDERRDAPTDTTVAPAPVGVGTSLPGTMEL